MDISSRTQLAEERRAHADALQLLQDVRDYLAHLPVVPANREMVRRVDEFMASPGAVAAGARAREEQRLSETWEASCFGPAGLPTLIAEVRHKTLLLAGPVLKQLAGDRQAVLTPTQDVLPAIELELRRAEALRVHMLPPIQAGQG